MLLLHGNSDHVHCWDWTAEQLPKNWSVVGYDFPGHGDSNFPENTYAPTHDLFGYSIRYVVDALGRVSNLTISIVLISKIMSRTVENDFSSVVSKFLRISRGMVCTLFFANYGPNFRDSVFWLGQLSLRGSQHGNFYCCSICESFSRKSGVPYLDRLFGGPNS